MISRTQKELSEEDIAVIAGTYHDWRGPHPRLSKRERSQKLSSPPWRGAGGEGVQGYQDQPGYCKSATLEDIRKHDFVLTPGRYVGAAPLEDDGIPFETKMAELSQTLYAQMAESAKLDAVIRENLEGLGYGE